jgi:hypothetical protein
MVADLPPFSHPEARAMNSFGLRRFGSILLLALGMGLLLGGCGDDTTVFVAVNWPGSPEKPNQGGGWVFISASGEHVETDDSSLAIEGTAFTPGPSVLGPDYSITWFNDANRRGGKTWSRLNQVPNEWRIEYGTIPLEPGENHITITADDGHGNIGRATLTVTRR